VTGAVPRPDRAGRSASPRATAAGQLSRQRTLAGSRRRRGSARPARSAASGTTGKPAARRACASMLPITAPLIALRPVDGLRAEVRAERYGLRAR